jgi:hypothetical protein
LLLLFLFFFFLGGGEQGPSAAHLRDAIVSQ